MKLDKKQIPALIVLALLVVGCVGYLSFKIVSPAHRPAQPAQPAKHAKPADDQAKAQADGQGEATITLAPQTTGVFPSLGSVPARRDPFTPQRLPGGELVETAKAMKYCPTIRETKAKRGNLSSFRVPPIDLAAINPFRASQSTSSVPSVQNTRIIATKPEDNQPEQDFRLTGVVSGDSNVVIIRIGKDERHVVKEGQTIDGRYRVKSVTGDGAVLVDGGQRILVKLGGNKNAK